MWVTLYTIFKYEELFLGHIVAFSYKKNTDLVKNLEIEKDVS